MMRRRLAIAAIVLLVVLGGLRLAVTQTYVHGYRLVDDYNIALLVTGANPTWRAVTELQETPTEVTVRISEMSLRLGPGSGDERPGEVAITLRDPLGTRRVVDASTGIEIWRQSP